MMQGLSRLDRATLVAWRTLNVLGWSTLAALGALAFQLWAAIQVHNIPGFQLSAASDLFARPGAEEGIDDSLAKFGLRIAMTLLVAPMIGVLVGRKVWRRPALYAALAAAAYVLLTLWVFEYSTSGSVFSEDGAGVETHYQLRTRLIDSLFYDAIVAATVPLSAWFAGRSAQRRGLSRVRFD